MKSFFISRPYWTGKGRSSPNWWRISCITCALGLRPAICLAGSTPGVLKKITNTSSVITNMTSTVHSSRRMMKLSTRAAVSCSAGMTGHGRRPGRSLPLHPQLGARVEGVTDAVSQDVQRQHREHDHDPGRDRDPRPRVEQALAVVDDAPPTGVGRLHADAKEGQGG